MRSSKFYEKHTQANDRIFNKLRSLEVKQALKKRNQLYSNCKDLLIGQKNKNHIEFWCQNNFLINI